MLMRVLRSATFAEQRTGHVRLNKKPYKLTCGFIAKRDEYGRK
jgi:hypothetical protein